jgi:hypothetical protein
MEQDPAKSGVRIAEYRHGAWSGEFPTIIVATLYFVAGGVAGGILSAIGKDVWEKLKLYLRKRFLKLERERLLKQGTREPRDRVLAVYILGNINDVPLIYYSIPAENDLYLEFDYDNLLQAEEKIRALIDTGKINKNIILGINLGKLGSGPYLSIFKEIPSQRTLDGPDAFTPHHEKTIEEITELISKEQ